MTNFKEAYSAFSDYVARQKSAIDSVRAELNESKAQLIDTEAELATAMRAAFPSVDAFPVVELTEASREAGINRDFTMLLSSMRRENRQRQEEMGQLVEDNGSYEVIQGEQAERGRIIGEQKAYADNVEREIGRYAARFRAFNRYRGEVDMAGNDPETIRSARNYFLQPTLFRRLSPTWWRGNKAVRTYESSGKNISLDWENYLQCKTEKSGIDERIAGLTAGIKSAAVVLQKMDAAKNSILSDEKILLVLHNNLVESIFDEKFVDAMIKRLGRDTVAPVLVPVLKIHNLHKVAGNLTEILTKMGVTLSQLETPLDRLARGARRVPSKNIDLDLGPIDDAVHGQEQFAGRIVKENAALRSGLRGYTPSSTLSTASPASDDGHMHFMNTMMLFYLINSSNCSHGYIHHSLGDGVNPTPSAPGDQSGSLGTLPSYSTGGLDASMPSMDFAGGISVPDVSIPNVSSGDYGGSSSSYDGGSSYSSSSSYDSGSSGYSSSSSYDSGSSSMSSSSFDSGGGGMSM